jgi:hypothetical protein
MKMKVCTCRYSHFHNDCLFFPIKNSQVYISEPKLTGSVFVLSVRYHYCFFYAQKKTIIMKMRVFGLEPCFCKTSMPRLTLTLTLVLFQQPQSRCLIRQLTQTMTPRRSSDSVSEFLPINTRLSTHAYMYTWILHTYVRLLSTHTTTIPCLSSPQ